MRNTLLVYCIEVNARTDWHSQEVESKSYLGWYCTGEKIVQAYWRSEQRLRLFQLLFELQYRVSCDQRSVRNRRYRRKFQICILARVSIPKFEKNIISYQAGVLILIKWSFHLRRRIRKSAYVRKMKKCVCTHSRKYCVFHMSN